MPRKRQHSATMTWSKVHTVPFITDVINLGWDVWRIVDSDQPVTTACVICGRPRNDLAVFLRPGVDDFLFVTVHDTHGVTFARGRIGLFRHAFKECVPFKRGRFLWVTPTPERRHRFPLSLPSYVCQTIYHAKAVQNSEGVIRSHLSTGRPIPYIGATEITCDKERASMPLSRLFTTGPPRTIANKIMCALVRVNRSAGHNLKGLNSVELDDVISGPWPNPLDEAGEDKKDGQVQPDIDMHVLLCSWYEHPVTPISGHVLGNLRFLLDHPFLNLIIAPVVRPLLDICRYWPLLFAREIKHPAVMIVMAMACMEASNMCVNYIKNAVAAIDGCATDAVSGRRVIPYSPCVGDNNKRIGNGLITSLLISTSKGELEETHAALSALHQHSPHTMTLFGVNRILGFVPVDGTAYTPVIPLWLESSCSPFWCTSVVARAMIRCKTCSIADLSVLSWCVNKVSWV